MCLVYIQESLLSDSTALLKQHLHWSLVVWYYLTQTLHDAQDTEFWKACLPQTSKKIFKTWLSDKMCHNVLLCFITLF